VSTGLASVQPDGPVYRVGRRPDAWAWPPWAYAAPDGTFGNRWDDPDGSYRVLYACSQRVGAFIETLARFRPDLKVVAALADIDGPDDGPTAGIVPRSWLASRLVGEGRLAGRYADVGAAGSLAMLRIILAGRALHYGLQDIDAAAIRLSAPRGFTQEISRLVYASTSPSFAGIRYLSRLGDGLVNWAIFESAQDVDAPVTSMSADDVSAADPDLVQALEVLGLRLS
jgi:hypothetical protein